MPGTPADSKAVYVNGKWEMHRSEPFVSTLTPNPGVLGAQDLDVVGTIKRPNTNPVDRERIEREMLAEIERLQQERQMTSDRRLIESIGLQLPYFNDDPEDDYATMRYFSSGQAYAGVC